MDIPENVHKIDTHSYLTFNQVKLGFIGANIFFLFLTPNID